jgi:hypothetical protein
VFSPNAKNKTTVTAIIIITAATIAKYLYFNKVFIKHSFSYTIFFYFHIISAVKQGGTTVNTRNSIKYYLANSARTNGKPIFIFLIIFLVVGIIFAIGRSTSLFASLFSEHLLSEFVVDLPVKAAALIVPTILFIKSKSHKEWQEAHHDIPKKDFTTAIYLEIFIASFVAVPVLFIIWIAAVLVDPSVIENILTIGVFNLGACFFWIWMMTALIYTLQFTKLANIREGAVLYVVCLFASLWLTVKLQSSLFSAGMPVAALICAFAGLIVLVVGRAITARLYKNFNL